MLPVLIVYALLAPKPQAPYIRCEVMVEGRISRSKAVSEGVQKYKTEDLKLRLPGYLVETAVPDGSVLFTFVTNTKELNASRTSLWTTTITQDGEVVPQLRFEGMAIRSLESLSLRSAARGQRFIVNEPWKISMEGQARLAGSASTLEKRDQDVFPLDAQGSLLWRDNANLEFEGISLWAIRNTKGPFTVQGRLRYGGDDHGTEVRVDLAFSFHLNTSIRVGYF